MRTPLSLVPSSWFWLVLVLVAGCGDEKPGLMYEEYRAPAGNERYIGGGCMTMDTSGSSSSGVAGGATVDPFPAYSISYQGGTDSITVHIADGAGNVLAQRVYSESFLHSHAVDEVVVALGDGYLKLRYWGEETCKEPRPPE